MAGEILHTKVPLQVVGEHEVESRMHPRLSAFLPEIRQLADALVVYGP